LDPGRAIFVQKMRIWARKPSRLPPRAPISPVGKGLDPGRAIFAQKTRI
jgi:hypothetical protein